jgi:hypothetical protein
MMHARMMRGMDFTLACVSFGRTSGDFKFIYPGYFLKICNFENMFSDTLPSRAIASELASQQNNNI